MNIIQSNPAVCAKKTFSLHVKIGLGKIVQLLKMCTAFLAQVLNLILSSYFGEFTSAPDSSSTESTLSSGFCEHHTHMHTHIQAHTCI